MRLDERRKLDWELEDKRRKREDFDNKYWLDEPDEKPLPMRTIQVDPKPIVFMNELRLKIKLGVVHATKKDEEI